jgi:hypothetical protein
VGMDCVEVAPAYDHAELTSNAAATVDLFVRSSGQVSLEKKTHVYFRSDTIQSRVTEPPLRGFTAPALQGEVRADVVVVEGPGLPACANHWLAQQGYQVVVLGADHICSGASGRN